MSSFYASTVEAAKENTQVHQIERDDLPLRRQKRNSINMYRLASSNMWTLFYSESSPCCRSSSLSCRDWNFHFAMSLAHHLTGLQSWDGLYLVVPAWMQTMIGWVFDILWKKTDSKSSCRKRKRWKNEEAVVEDIHGLVCHECCLSGTK